MHFDQNVRINAEISPIDIPITSIVTGLYLPAQVFSDLRDDGILGH